MITDLQKVMNKKLQVKMNLSVKAEKLGRWFSQGKYLIT